MQVKPPKNANYCATVVELSHFVELKNSDKLKGTIIFNNMVVVGLDMQPGQKGLFFPVESALSKEFLHEHSMHRDALLNKDTTKKGYFETHGRVKAMMFRTYNRSEGFFVPMDSLTGKFAAIGQLPTGTEFDEFDGIPVCKKYVIRESKTQGTPKESKKKNGKVVERFDRIVENQFRLHIDTANARKNFHIIKPDHVISITDKLHGTSAVFANVLTNRPLTFVEKIAKFFKVNLSDKEYGNIYSTRRVVKNKYINKEVNEGFYGVDVWGLVNKDLKDIIPKGITLYGEIVGYLPETQKMIQKGYHYGQTEGTYKFYAYRITSTNADGQVIEFAWQQIKDFCVKYGIPHVPEFYYGKASDLYKDIPVDSNWNDSVIKRMMEDFNLEKPCKLNNDEVPAEGVVIRYDSAFDANPIKLKAFAFTKRESELLDSGEGDIESDESSSEE